MQPEKKQLELLLMHYFRERNPDFPKGKLAASESPDFILKLKTRNRIGIELTRLNPLNSRVHSIGEQEQLTVREKIIDSSRTLFSQSSSFRLFVKIQFSDTIPIEAERLLSVAARVTNSIRNSVKHRKPAAFFYALIGSEELPRGIENILVVNHPELKVHIWERSNNLGISEDVVGDIHAAIQKKDEKLRLYHRQSLNFYWLIILVDRLQGVKNYNIQDKIMNQVFKSCFQQVYLFDLIKSNVVQLV